MSMNIEALVKKHSRAFRGDVRGLRNALTEQAETHAIELRAYEATVANLAERIRQLESERVPEGLALVPVETLQLIRCDVENAADWLSGAASALRNLQTYPKPKKEGSDEMAA